MMVTCISWMRAVDVRGHAQARAPRPRPSRPPRRAGQAPGPGAALPRRAMPRTTFGASPRGADADDDVAGPAERLDLAREDLLEGEVVGDGREGRGVGRQGDGRQRPSVPAEAAHQLGREVLRVGGAAAVAEDDQLAAGLEGRR